MRVRLKIKKLFQRKKPAYRLPAYVDSATANFGVSWPHILSNSLSGGQPLRPLALPADRSVVSSYSAFVWAVFIIGIFILLAVG